MSSVEPLAPSEPKFRFVGRLGLDEPRHQHVYGIMKAEAEQAWQRLQTGRDALLLHLRDRPSVQAPFAYGQVSELAVNREIYVIHQTASSVTRPFYDYVHEPGVINWVIKWLIWHIFRDRDQRKKARSREGQLEVQSPFSTVNMSSTPIERTTAMNAPGGNRYRTETMRTQNDQRPTGRRQALAGLVPNVPSERFARLGPTTEQRQQDDGQVGIDAIPSSRKRMPYDPVRDL